MIKEVTPAQCHSDGEKFGFLCVLAHASNQVYLSVIATLAPMKVNPQFIVVWILVNY
jgi:hypothetical protein